MIQPDSLSVLARLDLGAMSDIDKAGRPTRFMADLALAMRATAETARQATIDQCEADAKTYTQHLRARTTGDAASLHTAANADAGTIREWSKAEAERIRTEMDERIARRNIQLEDELKEYESAVQLEVHHVGERVTAFEAEIAAFFEKLLQGDDPTAFATMAALVPDPPAFGDPDPATLVHALRSGQGKAAPAGSAAKPGQAEEDASDHWWMDSPAALAARRAKAKAEAEAQH